MATSEIASRAPVSAEEILKGDLVPYGEAPAVKKQAIETAMREVDLKDTQSILYFGSKAQQELTQISDQMLEGVRNKDTGPAGAALNDMLASLRGFKVNDLVGGRKPGFLARMFGAVNPVVKFLQRYEDVRKQIDAIGDRLTQHEGKLMTDIVSLDRLYEANLSYFHHLADYIAAGEELLRRTDQEIIPAKEKEVAGTSDVLQAQSLRDLRASRDDLERRVHDLRLTRQVAMQSLPSIRLVQENDKSLVNKIRSTIANTVPLWRQQLAQAVTIARSAEAAETLKSASDLTNELLTSNAERLKQSNAEVRQQIERGVFDIEAVEKANKMLIATIEESLQIADEGKRKRVEAEDRLKACEAELRQTLAQAKARATGQSAPGQASPGATA